MELYKTLKDTSHLDLYTAERLIAETKKEYNSLDKKKIFEKQSTLIESLNKSAGPTAFSNFVPNYKTLASISQIFGDALSAKEKVLLERSLIGRLTSKPGSPSFEKEMEHIDNLVFKKVIENFNQKYDGQLLKEQQDLLNKYILSFDSGGLEFKVYLNEELVKIKEQLASLHESDDFSDDQDMSKKMSEVEDMVGRFQTKKISPDMIERIMKVQSLISECNT